MDDLTAEGFVLLGGSLGRQDVQLIVTAADETEIRTRLAGDPWGEEMLVLTEVRPWGILLGRERIAGPGGPPPLRSR